MTMEHPFVGIDVAKAQLDVAVRPTDQQWSLPHEEEEMGRLVTRLQDLAPTLIVLEAKRRVSGGRLPRR